MENQKIIFEIPEETSLIEIADGILKNNNLEESDQEFLDKYDKDIEPRGLILIDAALVITEKKISNEKIIELLGKHLETSKEIAEKILQDINQKIIPFAKTVNLNEQSINNEKYQEDLLNKIGENKNITITNKEIEQERKSMAPENKEPLTPQPKIDIKPDPYKEPIE